MFNSLDKDGDNVWKIEYITDKNTEWLYTYFSWTSWSWTLQTGRKGKYSKDRLFISLKKEVICVAIQFSFYISTQNKQLCFENENN